MNKIKVFIAILTIAIQAEDASNQSCQDLIQHHRDDQLILGGLQQQQTDSNLQGTLSDLQCVGNLVKGNYFESAKFVLGEMKNTDADSKKNLNKAQSSVQSAIEYVKGQQNEVIEMFDKKLEQSEGFKYSDDIPELTPSLRWTQSINDTFVEIKFSTRWDSPACLDLSDHNITLSGASVEGYGGNFLHISALCKNDNKYLFYKLDLKLYDEVGPWEFPQDHIDAQKEQDRVFAEQYQEWEVNNQTYTEELKEFDELQEAYDKQQEEIEEKKAEAEKDGGDYELSEDEKLIEPVKPKKPEYQPQPIDHPKNSFYNIESVGRIYLQLAKSSSPSRWRRLYDNEYQVKRGNIQFWWELSEKYDKELKELEKFPEDDGDDADDDARDTKHWSQPSQDNENQEDSEDASNKKAQKKPKKGKKKGNKKKNKSKPKEQKEEL